MQTTQNHWYVQVSGQAYGPYSYEQMNGFISEGRVIAGSLVSQNPEHGFALAAAFPAFAPTLAPRTVATPSPTPTQASAPVMQAPAIQAPLNPVPQTQYIQDPHSQPHSTQYNAAGATPSPIYNAEPKSVTVYLIMAEIRSDQAMRFLQALQAYGTAQRIGDTVWLLRSDIPLTALHEALSGSLTRQDRLFILDSFANKTAWSNIGADMDKRIRDMWGVS